jgi:multiple sugar transport system substrate-binding protein
MYPVPKEGIQTTTVMGGWELSIPQSSKNKDLTWELITLMLEPNVLAPMLGKTGHLPTQSSIGQGLFWHALNQTVPWFSLDAGKQVCHGIKEPKQALDDAAAKSAKLLGW